MATLVEAATRVAGQPTHSDTPPPVAPSTPDDAVPSSSAEVGARTGSNRLLVLLHGEKAGEPMVRDAIKRLRAEGHQITVRVTYEAGDVDRLVGEALALGGADTLVAAGGDGTVNEVVAALLRHTGGLEDTRSQGAGGTGTGAGRVVTGGAPTAPNMLADQQAAQAAATAPAPPCLTVGILPMGTSNDFAATTGIPEDPYDALELMTRPDTARPIDVGLLNGKVFMNTATIGASADVGKITSSGLKRLLGPAAFLVTGVRAATKWAPVDSVLRFPHLGLKEEQVDHMRGASVELTETDAAAAHALAAAASGGTAPAQAEATHGGTPQLQQHGHTGGVPPSESHSATPAPGAEGGSAAGTVGHDADAGGGELLRLAATMRGSEVQAAVPLEGKAVVVARASALGSGKRGGGVGEPAAAHPRTASPTRTSTTAPPAASAEEEAARAAAETQDNVGQVTGVPLLHLTAANNRQIASMVAVAPTALLDDGLLDCVYLTGTPSQQARRLIRDVLRRGFGGARGTPALLRVPWLEVAASEPLEWSLDGEPQDAPSPHFRFSLLHRAVRVHLPDDRMLVAGHSDTASEMGDDVAGHTSKAGSGRRARGKKRRLPKLRPGPTLGELLGRVVRFRKKKDWRASAWSFAGTVFRTALVAAAGGLLVHRLHVRARERQDLEGEQGSEGGRGAAGARNGKGIKGKSDAAEVPRVRKRALPVK